MQHERPLKISKQLVFIQTQQKVCVCIYKPESVSMSKSMLGSKRDLMPEFLPKHVPEIANTLNSSMHGFISGAVKGLQYKGDISCW